MTKIRIIRVELYSVIKKYYIANRSNKPFNYILLVYLIKFYNEILLD